MRGGERGTVARGQVREGDTSGFGITGVSGRRMSDR